MAFYFFLEIQCISNADKSDIVYSEKISYYFTSDYTIYIFSQ